MNPAMARALARRGERAATGRGASDRFPRRDRDHADRPAAAPGPELDPASHQGEERVVATATNTRARVEVSAALAHDDLAGVDHLTAVPLHAKPLSAGVAAVSAGGGALLVCPLRASS